MAFANVNTNATMWLNMGLKYLLAPAEAPEGFGLVATGGATHSTRPPNGQNMREKPQDSNAQFARRQAPPVPQRPPRQSEAAASEREPIAPQPPAWKPLPCDMWPLPWRARLDKTKKGKIVWTYWALGKDLDKNSEKNLSAAEAGQKKKRGEFLRKLIADLGMGAGTHTFWPACIIDEAGNPETNAEVFWSALPMLGSRAVIIFGSEAAKALLPSETLRPTLHLRKHGRLVWVLWDIDGLAAYPSKYNMLLTFLKNALTPFFHQETVAKNQPFTK